MNLTASDGRTPLHFAAEFGSPVIAHRLLQSKADHRIRSDAGESPMGVLQRLKLVPADSSDDDFPKFVRNQLLRAISNSFEQTQLLVTHATELIQLREQLIADHRRDQQRMAGQLGMYGTSRTVREYLLYTEEVVTLPEVPDDLTRDLQLPFPQEEVDAALSSATQTLLLAELTFGVSDPQYMKLRSIVDTLTVQLRPEGTAAQ